MKSKYINNIKIFAPESMEQLIAFAFEKKQMLIAMNAEKILNSNDFEKKIMNENIAYPDGIGAVLSLKKKGLNKTVKIAGCELWLEIIKLKEKDKKFYLVGGKQEVIENTVNKLKLDFPCIDIVNYRNGYINSEEEIITLEKDILSKKPDVIFVAMGSPKQELLMQRLKNVYPAVYQGLGGSFDVYTGSVKRAPEWWVKNNLEWAYRLIKQPSRIKRQLPLFKFIFYTLFNKY
jgi:UDP-N-acetyl-D-mannosaminouronate:lipid I N-acetyl-D-mannosaminouronosyltransferase